MAWHAELVLPEYLDGRPAAGVDDVVEVLVNPVQKPEEELLGIVLRITLKLEGAL